MSDRYVGVSAVGDNVLFDINDFRVALNLRTVLDGASKGDCYSKETVNRCRLLFYEHVVRTMGPQAEPVTDANGYGVVCDGGTAIGMSLEDAEDCAEKQVCGGSDEAHVVRRVATVTRKVAWSCGKRPSEVSGGPTVGRG